MIKRLHTSKLFYKKWLYKIVIECGGLGYLRRNGLDAVISLDAGNTTYTYSTWARISVQTAFANKANLIKIGSILETLLPKHKHQVRVESGSCSIFTNSLDLIDSIETDLLEFVVQVHTPVDNKVADFLDSNKNKIVCKELPHENYRFKVYFKNGITLNQDFRSGFLKWAEKFKDGRIHIPRGTQKLLEEDNNYCYGQYFYAKDSKIASMALLYMGNYINKTEEFVLKSEIA